MITNQYTYNGDGQRVQIVDSQGTKKQIWDGENVLLETDASDVTQVVYTNEPAGYGNLVSQRRGSTTSYYLHDALGSTRKLTDSSGSVTDSYDYRAYGETFASSGSTTNVFRWVGELGYYFDIDRSAYYLRARPYSPVLARFLSQDPLAYEGSLWNLYEYVNSRPADSHDPTGRNTSNEERRRAEKRRRMRKRIRRIRSKVGCVLVCTVGYDVCLEIAQDELEECLANARRLPPRIARDQIDVCMTIYYCDAAECATLYTACGLCCLVYLCNPWRFW